MIIPTRSTTDFLLENLTGLITPLVMPLLPSNLSPALIIGVLFGSISTLTKSLVDVVAPNGLILQAGSNHWISCPSTYGKSLVIKLFFGPIESCMDDFMASGLLPKHAEFLTEDANIESLIGLLQQFPVLTCVSDEAAMVKIFGKATPVTTKLLDASTIRRARVSTGAVSVKKPFFSVVGLEQPSIFEARKPEFGMRKGGNGIGTRFYFARVNPNGPIDANRACLPEYLAQQLKDRVHQLLKLSLDTIANKTPRFQLCLSAEATTYYFHAEAIVRQEMLFGRYSHIENYLQRHIQRTLQLAASFHVFNHGPTGEISLETFRSAEMLGRWYIDSAAEIFFEPAKLTKAEIDAFVLQNTIREFHFVTGAWGVTQSDLRLRALNAGLTHQRFSQALAMLCGRGLIYVAIQENRSCVFLRHEIFQN